MTSPARTDDPTKLEIAAIFGVAGFLLVPIMLVIGGLTITTATGSAPFYGAAIGALSGLLIAFALQLQPFLAALFRIVGRGDIVLMVLSLAAYLAVFMQGVASALVALQDCSGDRCGDSAAMNDVVVALISGGAYLVVAFGLAAIEAYRAANNRQGSRHRA